MPSIMTTQHLQVTVAPSPSTPRFVSRSDHEELAALRKQILRWEPRIADKRLLLAMERTAHGRRDLVGSMQLDKDRWLNFRSGDISTMWPIALRATWQTLVTAIVSVFAGLILLRLLTRPLRRMSEAANAIGLGQRITVRETGPTDLRNLAHAMNEMQERIAGLLEDQAKSFEAISHDLRTPLSRQKIAAELVDDAEVSEILLQSVDEMDAMLHSLQQFLRAQHSPAAPETVDLAAMMRDLLHPLGGRARLTSDLVPCVETFREPLQTSLAALIENARRYGQNVKVRICKRDAAWIIEIEDDGPGIPEEHFDDVLTPFFRLDEARGRSTPGFGLGIPTAHRLLTRFGGKLVFYPRAEGGLIVSVQVPQAS